jgi:hypothetical protein
MGLVGGSKEAVACMKEHQCKRYYGYCDSEDCETFSRAYSSS